MKRFRKIFFYTLGLVVVLALAAGVAVYAYRKPLLQRLVAEANKRLSTPVKIRHMEVNWWADFPHLAVVVNDVYVEDSHEEINPLFTAKRISFSLDLRNLWKGNYVIERISIYQSETNLKRNRKGDNNYNITKNAGDSTTLAFRLNRITLRDARVNYVDEASGHDHRFAAETLVARLEAENNLYGIEATGAVTIEQIGIGASRYFSGKDFTVQAVLEYDDTRKSVRIDPSYLKQKESRFSVVGSYSFQNENRINLAVKGEDATLQTLVTFLPGEAEKYLSRYKSRGKVYFDATLNGPVQAPALLVRFGWTDAQLVHPDYQISIEKASLAGTLSVAKTDDLSTAELKLTDISGQLNEQAIRARLVIYDFINPLADLSLDGTFHAAFINSLYSSPSIQNLTGALVAAIRYQGPLGTWKKPAPPKNAQGALQFQQVSFTYAPFNLPLQQLDGLVQFTKQDVALSNFSGNIGVTDFQVNGLFRNIIGHLTNASEPLLAEAEWKSNRVDVDELLSFFSSGEKKGMAPFRVPVEWTATMNYQIDHLRYGRFRARALAGDLQVRNQLIASRNVQMKTLGGELAFNGIVDVQSHKGPGVVGGFRLHNLHLDSIFYVNKDFGQAFIQSRHLRGRVDADVSLEFTTNEALALLPETLIADVTATIREGELNHFEPMQKLNRYLDDEGLSKLRFADLTNEIHIENQTVYIPQMEIGSNVTTIQLSGTHTFDQRIDYRVVAPLRSKKKIDPDEAFGAIEESKGQARVFLKITGTTDRYEVSYDKSAVKQKMANDLKQEVKELKDAFRLKGKQKKKELELSDEEFDWNE